MKKRNYTFYIIMNFLGCGIPIYLLLCVQQMHFVEYMHSFVSIGCYLCSMLFFIILNIMKNKSELNLLYWICAINLSYMFFSLPTLGFGTIGLLNASVSIVNIALLLLMIWRKEGYDYRTITINNQQ